MLHWLGLGQVSLGRRDWSKSTYSHPPLTYALPTRTTLQSYSLPAAKILSEAEFLPRCYSTNLTLDLTLTRTRAVTATVVSVKKCSLYCTVTLNFVRTFIELCQERELFGVAEGAVPARGERQLLAVYVYMRAPCELPVKPLRPPRPRPMRLPRASRAAISRATISRAGELPPTAVS